MKWLSLSEPFAQNEFIFITCILCVYLSLTISRTALKTNNIRLKGTVEIDITLLSFTFCQAQLH